MTLYPYRRKLTFIFEHPLNSEPLRIDVVIIKKEPGTVIDNPIGAIFRGVNIVEYKSPGDHLSVSDYHKVGAYTRLYSVQNGVETGDMSISFVTAGHPRKLFEYVKKEYGFEVREGRRGIYGIRGDIFPVQVIESGGLEGEGGGIWLKELRGGLNGERLREILEMSEKMPRGAPLSAYLYTVLQANGTGFKEMMGMSEVSFEAVLKEYGLTAKWEAEGLQKGLQTGLQKGLQTGLQKGLQQGMGEAVKRLQKHGMGPKEIAGVLELPLGTVRRYLKAE